MNSPDTLPRGCERVFVDYQMPQHHEDMKRDLSVTRVSPLLQNPIEWVGMVMTCGTKGPPRERTFVTTKTRRTEFRRIDIHRLVERMSNLDFRPAIHTEVYAWARKHLSLRWRHVGLAASFYYQEKWRYLFLDHLLSDRILGVTTLESLVPGTRFLFVRKDHLE